MKASSPIFSARARPSSRAASARSYALLARGQALVPEAPDEGNDEAMLAGEPDRLLRRAPCSRGTAPASPACPRACAAPAPGGRSRRRPARSAGPGRGPPPRRRGARSRHGHSRARTVRRRGGPRPRWPPRSRWPRALARSPPGSPRPLEGHGHLHERARLRGPILDPPGQLAVGSASSRDRTKSPTPKKRSARARWMAMSVAAGTRRQPARGVQRFALELQRLAEPERLRGLLGRLDR